MHPDAIFSDAGSTGSGPYYLETGTCKYAHDTLKEDFEKMIVAGHQLHVPVMIESAGTCGTDSGVDMMYGIAGIYCSQDPEVLKKKYRDGQKSKKLLFFRFNLLTFICSELICNQLPISN